MKKNYTSRLTLLALFSITLLFDSSCSKKEVVQPCYTCTSFITYSSNSPTFNTPSPWTKDSEVCDETAKANAEKEIVKTENVTSSTTLTTRTRTVCVKLAR